MKPISWRQNLFMVWLGQILAMAGTSLTLPFIPLYIRERFGIGEETQRGIYVSAFYFFGMLSFCISNPLWGAVGDKYGRKLMLLRAYFVTGVTFPMMMFAPSILWLIVIRFVASIFSGTVSAAQALVVTTTPEKHHGFALGTLSTALWSGNMIGLLGGGMIVHYFGYTWAFILCGATFLLGGFLTLFFVREEFVPPPPQVAQPGRKRTGLPDFSTAVWMLMGLFFMLSLARRFDEPFLAILVEMIGGAETAAYHTGVISALAALGGILSGMLFGYLSDRFAPVKIALPALAASGAAMLAQAGADSLAVLGAARFCAFFAVGGLEPVFLSVLSKVTRPERRGAAFGWSASARVTGGLVGAALGGVIVAFFGTRGVFLAGAVAMLLLVPVCGWLLKFCRSR